MKSKEELIEWLRDAYAMERGLEVALKKQAENEQVEMTVRQEMALHMAETQEHAEAIEACLEELGADTSSLKTVIGKGSALVQGMASAFARDERVKDLLTAYSGEHFEIACYQALREAAELLGEDSVVQLCDSILPDEERMAAWIKENLPMVVRSYLQREEMAAA